MHKTTLFQKPLDLQKFKSSFLRRTFEYIAKRLFDIVASTFGLIILSPLFLVIAILIKRDSDGPVFYWGVRMGRNRKTFRILKFRTMYETPHSYNGPSVTAKGDSRITPLGNWLRETKINELPQLWNVLIGEMSLVGPRPEDPALAKTWPINSAKEILSVRPGITSPASVIYRDEEDMLHAKNVMQKYLHELTPDKIRLDQLYVRYHSFWLDLDVILWTALLLLPKIREFSLPEQLLYSGPITRLFQRYMSWFIWDFLIAFVAFNLSNAFLRFFDASSLSSLQALQIAAGFSLLFNLSGVTFGTNRINWSKATTWNATRLLASWAASTGLLLGINILLGYDDLANVTFILVAVAFSLIGILAIRYRMHLTIGLLSRIAYSREKSQVARERVLIIGSGRTAEHIALLFDHPTYSNRFQVVGLVDEDLRNQNLNIYGTKVVGTYDDISQLIQNQDIGTILVADSRISLEKYKFLTEISSMEQVQLAMVPDLFGSLKELFNTPPFHFQNTSEFEEQYSPSKYYLGRYSRLELEYQIEKMEEVLHD